MAWYGWLLLIAILAVPAVICGVLYSGKNDSTPCVGCGECIRSGECVFVKKRKKTMAEKAKKQQKSS